MIFGKKKGLPIESLIGKDARIQGHVEFEGGLRVDGHIVGNLTATEGKSSMLVISEQASVTGEIRVAHLIVNGTINGPVYATELLELQPKACVRGNVYYAAFEMHQGAVVDGCLVHTTTEEEVGQRGLKLSASNE